MSTKPRIEQIGEDLLRARAMDPEEWGPLAIDHLTYALGLYQQSFDAMLELAKCPSCRGKGEVSHPLGTEGCPRCDGTGLADETARRVARLSLGKE